MDLQSHTALVTGGAVRIGRAICEALAAKGCDVVVHYNRSSSEAADLLADLQHAGVKAFSVCGTLCSQEDCEKVIAEAWEKTGRIDILVNNAAVFHKDTLMSATEEKVLAELKVNFFAPMMLTRSFARRILSFDIHPHPHPLPPPEAGELEACLPSGRERAKVQTIDPLPSREMSKVQVERGKVINLLDRRIAGNETGCLPYLLSKKMLAEFTRLAALELAPAITVNGVAPGAVLMPPVAAEVRGQRSEVSEEKSGNEKVRPHYIRDLAGKVPLDRQCTAEDAAAAVIFLLESDAITGQIIFVDGGQHLLGTVEEFTPPNSAI